jgi:uncharacterized protein (DUF427 family)
MKIPGPDHPITIVPHPKRVRVMAGGEVLADSGRTLALSEANYPIVRYVPREDADMARMRRTGHHTMCPYKGEASYFSILTDAGVVENAVWTYEDPHAAVEPIRGHLAFYPSKVDAIEDL